MTTTTSTYQDLSLDQLKALQEELQALIHQRLQDETLSSDQLPIARHLSLVAAIESLVMSYRNFRYSLAFDDQRQLDRSSVKMPALQGFHTRMERLCGVIRLHPNAPLPRSLATSLIEIKGLVYYRCLAGAPLPPLIADDMSLFALIDHLVQSLHELRHHAAIR